MLDPRHLEVARESVRDGVGWACHLVLLWDVTVTALVIVEQMESGGWDFIRDDAA